MSKPIPRTYVFALFDASNSDDAKTYVWLLPTETRAHNMYEKHRKSRSWKLSKLLPPVKMPVSAFAEFSEISKGYYVKRFQ